MSTTQNEAPNFSPAETNRNPEDFQRDYTEAQAWLQQVKYQPEFQAMQSRAQLDPADDQSPRYWAAVYAYTQRDIARRRAAGDESEATLRMQQLVGITPHAAITQTHHRAGRIPQQHVHDAVTTLSRYNDSLRGVAEQYSGLTVSRMTNNLHNTLNTGLKAPSLRHIRNGAVDTVREAVRGAQKEMQQQQIVEAAGYTILESSTKDDVNKATDYKVRRDDGRIVRINSKSSGVKIKQINGGSENRIAYDYSKDVLLVNTLHDDESGDTFELRSEILENKANLMRAAIEAVPKDPSRSAVGRAALYYTSA